MPLSNYSEPVGHVDAFFGRARELDYVASVFRDRQRSLIILGERRIGKTSLLNVTPSLLAARQIDHYRFVSLPPSRTIHSLAGFVWAMVDRLCGALDKEPEETGLFDPQGRLAGASQLQTLDGLRRLLLATGDTCVLRIDEFDAILLEYARDAAQDILGLVELILGSDLPLFIYLTMSDTAVESSLGSLGLSKSPSLELRPLAPPAAEDMILKLCAGEVAVEPLAVKRVAELAGGNPYFIKVLLHFAFEGGGALTETAVSQALERAVGHAAVASVMRNIYDVHLATAEQKQLVLLLAWREGSLTEDELRVLGGPFMTAANNLRRRGYLQEEAKDFSLLLEFLAHWVREWDKYEEELETHGIAALDQKLKTWKSPWEHIPTTTVDDNDLQDLGPRFGR